MNRTPYQVIREKGIANIAERVGLRAESVRMWGHRQSIPRTVWPELTRHFPDLTTEALLAVERAGLEERRARNEAA